MRVEFFPEAEQEIEEASEYYESRVGGLGLEFVAEVEQLASVLVDLDSVGEPLDKIHRRIPLRRFPFVLIYRADDEIVRIVAVAHRRRRPRYWQTRVQDR